MHRLNNVLNNFFNKLFRFVLPIIFVSGAASATFLSVAPPQKPIDINLKLKAPRRVPGTSKVMVGTNDDNSLFQRLTPPADSQSNKLMFNELFSFFPEEIPVPLKHINGVPQNLVFALQPEGSEAVSTEEVFGKIYPFLINQLDELETAFSNQNIRFFEADWNNSNVFFDALKLFLTAGETKPRTGWTEEQIKKFFSLKVTVIDDGCIINTGPEIKCTRTEVHGNLEIKLKSIFNLLLAFAKNIWAEMESSDKDSLLPSLAVITGENSNRSFLLNYQNLQIIFQFFQDNPTKLEEIIEGIIVDNVRKDVFLNHDTRNQDMSFLDIVVGGQFADFFITLAFNKIADILRDQINITAAKSILNGLEKAFRFLFSLAESINSDNDPSVSETEVDEKTVSINTESTDPDSPQIEQSLTEINNPGSASYFSYLFSSQGIDKPDVVSPSPTVNVSDFWLDNFIPLAFQFFEWTKSTTLSATGVTADSANEIKQILAHYADEYFASPTTFNFADIEPLPAITMHSVSPAEAGTNTFAFSWSNSAGDPFSASIYRKEKTKGRAYQINYFAPNHWAIPTIKKPTKPESPDQPELMEEFFRAEKPTEDFGFHSVVENGRELIIDEYNDYAWQVFPIEERPEVIGTGEWKKDGFDEAKKIVRSFLNSLPGADENSFAFDETTQKGSITINHDLNDKTWNFTLAISAPSEGTRVWALAPEVFLDGSIWTEPLPFILTKRELRKVINEYGRQLEARAKAPQISKTEQLIQAINQQISSSASPSFSVDGITQEIISSNNDKTRTYTIRIPNHDLISSYELTVNLFADGYPVTELRFDIGTSGTENWEIASITEDADLASQEDLMTRVSEIIAELSRRKKLFNWISSFELEDVRFSLTGFDSHESRTVTAEYTFSSGSNRTSVTLEISLDKWTPVTFTLSQEWDNHEEVLLVPTNNDEARKIAVFAAVSKAFEKYHTELLARQTVKFGSVLLPEGVTSEPTTWDDATPSATTALSYKDINFKLVVVVNKDDQFDWKINSAVISRQEGEEWTNTEIEISRSASRNYGRAAAIVKNHLLTYLSPTSPIENFEFEPLAEWTQSTTSSSEGDIFFEYVRNDHEVFRYKFTHNPEGLVTQIEMNKGTFTLTSCSGFFSCWGFVPERQYSWESADEVPVFDEDAALDFWNPVARTEAQTAITTKLAELSWEL